MQNLLNLLNLLNVRCWSRWRRCVSVLAARATKEAAIIRNVSGRRCSKRLCMITVSRIMGENSQYELPASPGDQHNSVIATTARTQWRSPICGFVVDFSSFFNRQATH